LQTKSLEIHELTLRKGRRVRTEGVSKTTPKRRRRRERRGEREKKERGRERRKARKKG